MRITLLAFGMQMWPGITSQRGLGGSETAQICVAEALAAMGHVVTLITNVPPAKVGRGTHNGVLWVPWEELEHMNKTGTGHPCDLLIVCRRPELIERGRFDAAAKVLWVQDFAAEPYPRTEALHHYDEIWYVSQWQFHQWCARLGGESWLLPKGWLTRNGIAPWSLGVLTPDMTRKDPRQLLYASRPERGLYELVREGGIMDSLEEYRLKVLCYADFPPTHAELYRRVFGLCQQHPRVDLVGDASNFGVRVHIRQSAALVLPTNYAETSCMVAREAIEQLVPVFATLPSREPAATNGGGALRETVGDAGMFVDPKDYGSDAWCRLFAQMVRNGLETPELSRRMRQGALRRHDLDWDTVARDWTAHTEFDLGLAGL